MKLGWPGSAPSFQSGNQWTSMNQPLMPWLLSPFLWVFPLPVHRLVTLGSHRRSGQSSMPFQAAWNQVSSLGSQEKFSGLLMTTGWWFEPLWKIWKSIGMIIPNIWENRKCSKPPTSDDYVWLCMFLFRFHLMFEADIPSKQPPTGRWSESLARDTCVWGKK